MSGYGDLKIDETLADIAADVAEDFYGQTYAATKTMGEEAVLLWLLLRVDSVAADTVADVLAQYDYDDLDALMDDVRERHQTHTDELIDPDALRAVQATLTNQLSEAADD